VSKDATRYPAGDWVDRFAAGYTPRYFIRNLLDGRYALVAPLPTDSVNTTYWSGLERYDASIAWKMNLLLTYAYDPVQDPATGAFYFEPGPKLSEFGWFADCFGPWEARDAGVAVRVRGSGGLVCAAKGQLGLSQAPAPSTTLVATLREGEGDATVRVAGPPTLLQVTRLNDQDEIAAAPESAAVVQSCLATEGKGRALTLRAVDGDGDWTCRTGNDGPVLELPVGKGGTAHVALDVAAADSPAITASSSDGSYTPFVVANPTPN
jgi:hypothetical protein